MNIDVVPFFGPNLPTFQKLFCTMLGSFHINLKFSASLVVEGKIFKEFSYINTCKSDFYLLGLLLISLPCPL
jgi:hypothetical protein